MKILSPIDEIAEYLAQHENATRIKKLMFCVCKNIWENDQTTLNCFKLTELIAELKRLNPTTDGLKNSLSKVVKSLNKPKEYALVANIIFNQLQKLYQQIEESQPIVSISNPSESQTGLIQNISESPLILYPELPLKSEQLINSFDLFSVKQEIMKYANPLRVKILIFSTLIYQFSFNETNWSRLRAEELDNLLQDLFSYYPNIKDLQARLNNIADKLEDANEYIKVVAIIIQALKPFYTAIQSSKNQSQESIEIGSNINLTNEILPNYEDFSFSEDDNTCQFAMPPNPNMFKNKQ